MSVRALTLTLAAALTVAASARAADPPITFQTRPLGDDLKIAQAVMGWLPPEARNNAEAKQFLATLQELQNPKTSGLDPSKPVVGYVIVTPDLKASVGVAALPVTDAKVFQTYLQGKPGVKFKDLGGGLTEIVPPKAKEDTRVLFRAQGQHVYFAIGKDPTSALDPKSLIATDKLTDPAERSLVAVRVYFDRLPKEVREDAAKKLSEGLKEIQKSILPPDAGPDVQKAGEQIMKMLTRYATQLGEAEGAVIRFDLNGASGEFAIALTLNPKPNTSLAKDLASRKPAGNKFAGLLATDTAAGFKARLPLWNAELQGAAITGLEAIERNALSDPKSKPFEPLVKEAVAAAIRTVKTGEFDVAAGLKGPDKSGAFTAVVAIALEDPSKVEQQAKALFNMFAGETPEVKKLVTLDAAKAGTVNIHKIDLAGLPLPPEVSKLFGTKPNLALAFAPNGLFVAIGPDAVGTLQQVIGKKPETSPDLDVLANPARIAKLADALAGAGPVVARVLGTEDRLISQLSLAISGGQNLHVRMAFNLKALVSLGAVGAGKAGPPPAGKSSVAPPPNRK